ncbi:MAG: transposase, partial [Candidatus Methylacidiphilaceae bacterium]
PVGGADLEGILCIQEDRIVGNDNTVHWGRKKFQILPQSWRGSLAKCRVRVCEHLDGNISIRYGHRIVGWYDAEGNAQELSKIKAA